MDSTQPRIILASQSPRRREKIALVADNVEIITAGCPEIETGEPAHVVLQNAYNKAWVVYDDNRDAVIIGADTVVALGDEIMGKPVDLDDARRMLRCLSGNRHTVVTGMCVMNASHCVVRIDKTDVYFKQLSDADIDAYLALGESMDKAGAYAIQMGGAALVERYDGDYDNAVGLCVASLKQVLSAGFGVSVLP